jgi:sugar lactone lactonase YvrE
MKRRFPWLSVAGLLVLVWVVVPAASTARFWHASTQADLQKGQVERLSIDDRGHLVLGPDARTILEAPTPFLWSLAVGPDGVVYAGGGNDGQVWRVDAKGAGSVFFDAGELEVHALSVGPDGLLYVGTSPDGKVYRLDAQGKSSVFFDPGDKYIWALAFDAERRLYVGTGDKGVVYRVSPDGTSEVFCRTQATHAESLVFDLQGQLLVGTESPGRVLRVGPAGKPFVVLDSPFREIRGLRVDRTGAIFAAAVNGKPGGEDRSAAPPPGEAPRAPTVASVSTEITAITVMDAPQTGGGATSAPRAQPAPTAKGAVYRVDAAGGAEIIWDSRDDQPFDLLIEPAGSVLVTTGNTGKLYRLAGDPWRAMLVTRLDGQQVTSALAVGTATYFTTSNPAKIIRIGDGVAPDGTYTSDAKDAGTVASWGTLSWRAVASAPGHVQVFTRSGNTPTPDNTWSEWAGPYERQDGQPITSPPARYFQWKAALKRGTSTQAAPALISLTVAYLQRNLRPRVTSIAVQPPGIAFQKPYPTGEPEIAGLGDVPGESRMPVFSLPLGSGVPAPASGPALGRRMYQKGLRTFTWKAEDENEDRLQYDVLFRTTGDAAWHVLRRETSDQILTWDTTSVPDGTYLIKIAASDAVNNAPGTSLVGSLDSEAFDIDNGAPVVTVLRVVKEGTSSRIVFEVRDAQSAVSVAEYSVDAGRWQPAYPVDGAADARVERYEIRVEGDASGRVVIRAADIMNNASTARVDGTPRSG